MGRPSKPIELVKGHRTKKEKEIRKKAESQLYSGSALQESTDVKNNPVAHKEFLRLSKLFKAIGKNDDLAGSVINQHCLIYAECKELEKVKALYVESLEKFEDRLGEEEISFSEEMKLRVKLQKQILDTDRALMTKRKMLLDIAKENLLTIASQLRSIPKKPVEEEKEDPMAKFLAKRG